MSHAMLEIAEKIKIQEMLILTQKMELIHLKRAMELMELDMVREVNNEVDENNKLVNTNETKRQIALELLKCNNKIYVDLVADIETKKYKGDVSQIELNFLRNSFEFYKIRTTQGKGDFLPNIEMLEAKLTREFVEVPIDKFKKKRKKQPHLADYEI